MSDKRMVRFESEGLLSKWGFGDGDMLDDILWDQAEADGIEDYTSGDEHVVLIRAVREYLLPAIHQQVEVYEISTNHNPIRARSINGEPVDGDEELTPEFVEVPFDVLYAWWKQTLPIDTTSRETHHLPPPPAQEETSQ